MEEKGCPSTVTIRRNPPRRARPTPSSANISAFPLADILSIDVTNQSTSTNSNSNNSDSNLKVFLRVRGVANKQKKSCVIVNDDLHSVTVTPPSCASGRSKSEVYTGFSHVFSPLSTQDEVYDTMMKPFVEDFLKGTSSLLAALGPTGSGKTHTIFGSPQRPGLLPRALAHIFNSSSRTSSFYMSIFEISIEKGKSEKLCDLSPDATHIFMQQSVVKGLKQVLIKDVEQAEAIVAAAMLKRATAVTNSNAHSSRSQCIINITYTLDERDTELTFVDLAGAERERKTGNQGGRLLESNFINNTSMVFGLCLRSLLEHQKNPKKPLQKHFQSSLLTRYLRDYLEGRKRMALILTARSGPEDYFDASFLLRQASPFMEIKFQNMEETSKLPGNKRRKQMTCSDNQKRVKLSNADEKDGVERTTGGLSKFSNEDISNKVNDDSMEASEAALAEVNNPNAKLQRDYYVMQGFAKALWNVLKQYKEKVKAMQTEIDLLTENISTGHVQYLEMEKELQHLKSCCFCPRQQLPNHQPVGIIAPEEQPKASPSECKSPSFSPEEQPKASPSECKSPSFSQERDDCNHLLSEVTERSFSEAGCRWDNNEIIRLPRHEHSEGKSEFSGLQTLQKRSREIQDLDNTVVCETLEFVNEKTEHDAISRTPFQGAALPSNDVESSVQQDYQPCIQEVHLSAIKCEISRECVGIVDKDPMKKIDTTLKDAAAHVPKSHVVDLTAHSENIGDSVDEKMEKENVTNALQSNFNSKLEAKEISRNPLKSERPKRRLMPASSLLLRDSGTLDVSDDDVKHRGGRGGQRLTGDECKRTKGSASLLRMLKNHFPR
ncbi:kinesin-like protein KIN-6 isoform X1 [Silene latifolia]|uniref:kinesin-like protein KIN-6 isoform X1 n=1 Tax=Silene latifolia TaxID=37657 RepID=UPI003D78463C